MNPTHIKMQFVKGIENLYAEGRIEESYQRCCVAFELDIKNRAVVSSLLCLFVQLAAELNKQEEIAPIIEKFVGKSSSNWTFELAFI